jgi:8-oxo-dGTP diphosphatase
VDDAGRTLLVRKRGTNAFMQPGGKLAAGEDAMQALAREILEELGCRLSLETQPLGRFRAPAANEENSIVEAELFSVVLLGEITPANEIAEAVWYDPCEPAPSLLAPLTRDHVLPLIRSRAI